MAKVDVDNAEKALKYFLNARRAAARAHASRLDEGTSRHNDYELAEQFAKIQKGVEAARAALKEENTDPEYIDEVSESIILI